MKNVGILFPLAGRLVKPLQNNDNEPKDFYYGIDKLIERDNHQIKVSFIESRMSSKILSKKIDIFLKRVINRIFRFKFSEPRIKLVKNEINASDLVISFTDSGSLSLGKLKNIFSPKTILIGGFHGLSDAILDVHPVFRKWYKLKIHKSLLNLDHIFFFGEKDRQNCIKLFGLNENKTSLFRHGVDTSFWCPNKNIKQENHILSIGSDPRRDYKTLILSQNQYKVKILTKINLKSFSHFKHFSIMKGSFHNKGITNLELNNMYNSASLIVVPIKDVFQPSGYSVTLQALACGKTVILPDFKGLWDRDSFKHLKNCVLYKPEDPQNLGEMITYVMENNELKKQIGENARALAVEKFGLERTYIDLIKLTKINKTDN